MNRWITSLPILALLFGCGQFSNVPLKRGGIRGILLQADKNVGQVWIVDHPDQHSGLESDGRFEIDDLAAGSYDVFLGWSAQSAGRRLVEVREREFADLGALSPEAAAFLIVRVQLITPFAKFEDVQLLILGTPYREIRPDATGQIASPPLGAGCYAFQVLYKGQLSNSLSLCFASGEQKTIDVSI